MRARCVYGPVPSRRLGLSLGVDLVPHKVCCYDCSYCQVGPTTQLDIERREFLDPLEVARQVAEALQRRPDASIVTLSGSGEPTLYRELAALVAELRRVTRLPLALLTNGGLLWDEDVARAALAFDLVAPTLDAADAATFAAINRPHPAITYARMLQGLRDFCRAFRGTCRLEVLLVRGVNDAPPALDALAALAAELAPTTVDLNTVVRPPAHGAARLDDAALRAALARFARCRGATIVAPFTAPTGDVPRPADDAALARRVVETVARRPCTVEDLCHVLAADVAAVCAACAAALAAGEIVEETRGGALYYRAAAHEP